MKGIMLKAVKSRNEWLAEPTIFDGSGFVLEQGCKEIDITGVQVLLGGGRRSIKNCILENC